MRKYYAGDCMEYTPAPIDGKTIMEDWIFDNILESEYCFANDNNGRVRHIIGWFSDALVEVKWSFGDNRVCFALHPLAEDEPCVIIKAQENLMQILNEIKDANNLIIEYDMNVNGWNVVCSFYEQN